ncbi:MAG: hypothetical protein KatS3mg111_1585 [Pirellulaceae bacterium]|nr:MAG: hypothetical protein KatS3mg111_1585 [Pirellulaceae bacterium]
MSRPMTDEWEFVDGSIELPRRSQSIAQPTLKQFTLVELFFTTTLTAVLLFVYLRLSPIAALLGGGALMVVAVVRWTGCRNILLGGLIGFLASTLLAYAVIVLRHTSDSVSIALLLLCPATGYIAGAFLAELRSISDG